jgi:hypothetical protein
MGGLERRIQPERYAIRDKKLQYNFLCKNIRLQITAILTLVAKIFCINRILESVKHMIHYTKGTTECNYNIYEKFRLYITKYF